MTQGLTLDGAAHAMGITRDEGHYLLIESNTGTTTPVDYPPDKLLDELAGLRSADDLRRLGRQLLKVADAIDQDWHPDNVKRPFLWLSSAARIERNALELAKTAELILDFRGKRSKFIPSALLGEPAWDMLLELFIQFARGAVMSTKSLIVSSKVPPTTALRHIVVMEKSGYLTRRRSGKDRRVTLIDLTEKGVVAVGTALKAFPG